MSEQAMNMEPLSDAELVELKKAMLSWCDCYDDEDNDSTHAECKDTLRLIAEIESRRRLDDQPFALKTAIPGEISEARGGGILNNDDKSLDSCDDNCNG